MYHKPNEIIQAEKNGIILSWNPDDNRFYVSRNNEQLGNYKDWQLGNYKDWRNATAKFRQVTR
jgi:hypothetical protein